MGRIDYGYQRLAKQFGGYQPVRQRHGPHQPHLDGLVEDALGNVTAAHFLEVQVYRGEPLAKCMNGLGDLRRERGGRGEADFHLAQLTQLRTARDIGRFFHLRHDLPGLVEEQPPGLAQFDPTIGPLEQPRPQLLLQGLDLLAKWRLGDPQMLGGAAKVQLFGNGDEITQMAQFHRGLQTSRKSS